MVDTPAMFRCLTMVLFGGATYAAAAQEPADPANCVVSPADPRPDCIEAVVLAHVREYRPREIGPLAEDEIVMSWTWDVDVHVDKVYLGNIRRGPLTIGATLHTEFNPELRQPVMFLTRKFDMWYLSYIEWAARDASGRWVLPLFEEPDEQWLSPEGWLPKDYAKWLRPVRYREADVAGFAGGYDEPDADSPWLRIRNRHRTAKQGFDVKDIPAMLAERRAIECAQEEPGGEARS